MRFKADFEILKDRLNEDKGDQHDGKLGILKEAKPFIQKNFEAAGFEKPTAIQEQTAEWITEKRDVIAESPTGTGRPLRMFCRF